VNYQWSFVEHYLQHKQRMIWWVQIEEEKALELEIQKIYLPTVGMLTVILEVVKKCGSTMLTFATCFKRERMRCLDLEETEV
jgi:hypothetical protein